MDLLNTWLHARNTFEKKNKNPEIYHINFDYNIVRLYFGKCPTHKYENHTDSTKANFVSNARIILIVTYVLY